MRKSDCVSAGVQPLVFYWQEAAGNSDQEVPGSCLSICSARALVKAQQGIT